MLCRSDVKSKHNIYIYIIMQRTMAIHQGEHLVAACASRQCQERIIFRHVAIWRQARWQNCASCTFWFRYDKLLHIITWNLIMSHCMLFYYIISCNSISNHITLQYVTLVWCIYMCVFNVILFCFIVLCFTFLFNSISFI